MVIIIGFSLILKILINLINLVSKRKMSPQPNLHCHEEEIFLMDSPCSSGRTAATNTLIGHQPQRYYNPFGQNANELSLERKRLLRMTLQQAAAQQHEQECRQRGLIRTVDLQQQEVNSIGGSVETPKNGAKVSLLGKMICYKISYI